MMVVWTMTCSVHASHHFLDPLTCNTSKNLHFSLTCSPLKGHTVEIQSENCNVSNFNEAVIQRDIIVSLPKLHSAP